MSYFDSHCHLTDDRFHGDVEGVIDRAREAGVAGMVVIASDEEDAVAARDLAVRHGLWSTAGIHPHAAERADRGFERVRELVAMDGVVAIGETGLDYYYDNAPRRTQREAFERHLELAAETGRPLVVHCREADDDAIAMIRSAEGAAGGVLHCFAGGRALFDAGIEAGWYISFSGLVTFGSYESAPLAAEVPEDRLLIETDSPYLAPVPHRGKRNEPAYVVEVAKAVAEVLDVAPEIVAERTTRNARRFYSLEEAT